MSLEALAEADKVALPPWVRLHFDRVRDRWVLLAPERVLFPCPTSVEIIQKLGDRPTLHDLIDGLAAEYDAPREAIAGDVTRLLGDLAAQGFIEARTHD